MTEKKKTLSDIVGGALDRIKPNSKLEKIIEDCVTTDNVFEILSFVKEGEFDWVDEMRNDAFMKMYDVFVGLMFIEMSNRLNKACKDLNQTEAQRAQQEKKEEQHRRSVNTQIKNLKESNEQLTQQLESAKTTEEELRTRLNNAVQQVKEMAKNERIRNERTLQAVQADLKFQGDIMKESYEKNMKKLIQQTTTPNKILV